MMVTKMDTKIKALKKLLELYKHVGCEAYMEVNNLMKFLKVDANELGSALNELLADGTIIGKGFGRKQGDPGETVGVACNPYRIDKILVATA